MSDLAPFVAAVIRDQTVQELYEENRRLRALLDANRYDIEITGPNGAPTYAACDVTGKWGDRLRETPKSNFVHELLEMEIHMRGFSSSSSSSSSCSAPVYTIRDMIVSPDWKLYMAPNRNHICYLLTTRECEDKYYVSGLQLELHYVNHRQLETLFTVFNNPKNKTKGNDGEQHQCPLHRQQETTERHVFAPEYWKAPSSSGYAVMKWGDFQLSPRGVAHLQTIHPDIIFHVVPTCGNNATRLYGN